LDYPDPIPGRVRRPGGGRPSAAVTGPTLWEALDALVDPVTRGDPESALRWTTKSTTKLAGELAASGHQASPSTVAKLLKANGYSLQANSKTIEGNQHVDRDAQFNYLNDQATAFTAAGDPVISVDTKKKELIGNFTAAGREWEPQGRPTDTNVHDFVDKSWGRSRRTGSTTSPPTPGGSMSAPTPTPANSPSNRSAGGGTRLAPALIPRPAGC